MPITINGTTVTTNSINGTSISSETVNGTQVYGGTVSKVWYYYMQQSSEPSEYTPYNDIYSQSNYPTDSELEDFMTSLFPPANIPVGTIGWLYSTYHGWHYMFMIIEE